ncbi:uncharacterized protein LOC114849579 isoform X1 [Betta splendens]|uniref:Uncharacterized protein LOC114849579 isoform X1 n=1 Tax=Betta splendens TaxID=158456 RepID=A0A6P7LSW0_BETSP|nr:uncharacterized protein LOC114849579 isoform X1 [Betta splendens]
MVGHTWIHSLLIVTGLQFTGAALIRRGDDVSFPCNNLIPDQSQCNTTTWLYSVSGPALVELVTLGKIRENDASKSNRLSLTENCSLVIKQITDQDAGRYTCRQYNKSGRQQGVDAAVDLSVVTLTQHEHDDEVTLNCHVWTNSQCRHTVKWLFEDKDLEKTSIKSSESLCDAAVTFSRSSFYSSRSITSFTCEVRDGHNHQSSTFNLQPQGDDKPPATGGGLWRNVVVSVAVTSLVVVVVTVHVWTRAEGNKGTDQAVHGDEDDGEGAATYENARDSSASV